MIIGYSTMSLTNKFFVLRIKHSGRRQITRRQANFTIYLSLVMFP